MSSEPLGAQALAVARAAGHTTSVDIDYPIRIRELEVLRTEWIAPRMIRLVLGGPQLEGFESHLPDEHVKFIFPDPDTGELRVPVPDGDELDWPTPFPTSREYSVRHLDVEAGEIWFDVAIHRGGLASDWVEAAKPGDRLPVAGPPGAYYVPDAYDHYVLASDESGLPPLARMLEQLPADAHGWAFVEVDGPDHELDLVHPAGVEVHWLHRDGVAPGRSDVLARVVPEVVKVSPDDATYVWFSAEAGSIKPLRRWVREIVKAAKTDASITGYWKVGKVDEHEHLDDDED